MPIPEHARREVRQMAGGGALSGDGAPNGMNIVGALNRVDRYARLIEDNGYNDYTELAPDRREDYENAWEDLQYWSQVMSNVFAQDIVGQDDSIEVPTEDEDGNEIIVNAGNPHGATETGNNHADLPADPRGGDE